MHQNMASTPTIVFMIFNFLLAIPSHSFPLSTSSRWIIDTRTGNRVKLACVNWPGHLHAMIPEGLNKRPLKTIAAEISYMGFNCVRLTWATYMYTRPDNANITVAQSLDRWDLVAAKEGVVRNNPDILEMSIWDAQRSVIDELGAHNVMVVLDNHVSMPKWCCGPDDGNGFFGDQYFDPVEWMQGLTAVARRYRGNPSVVAMSMRNELRGARANVNDWYKYMQEGATAIQTQNPELLIIFSGLSTDTDLKFLRNQSLTINLNSKLVVEAHWYSFGQPLDKWLYQTNDYCATVTKSFMDNCGFLFNQGENSVPLFLSEFGADQRGVNERENRYLNCLLGVVAEYDLDWALWVLTGSYMLREDELDVEELFGMYDFNWDQLRNSTFHQRLQPIQMKNQDSNIIDPAAYIIYHPLTGKCIDGSSGSILPMSCQCASKWAYNKNGSNSSPISLTTMPLTDSGPCLKSLGPNLVPVITGEDCMGLQSSWTIASRSKNHLVVKDAQGNNLCLDWDSTYARFVTNKCRCLDHDLNDVTRCEDNPQRQWFKLVPTTMEQGSQCSGSNMYRTSRNGSSYLGRDFLFSNRITPILYIFVLFVINNHVIQI